MELTFGEMEAVFSARYDLAVPTLAFRGRLQHLQRSGFPTGVNTGKGKRAIYGWRQLVQLSVALDLIETGLMPDVAKGLVLLESHDIFSAAASMGVDLSSGELIRAAESGKLAVSKRPFLLTSAGALSTLGEGLDDEILISVVPATAFLGQMRAGNPRAAVGTYIDLGARLSLMLNHISGVTQQEISAVVASFQKWASSRVVNP